MVELEQPLEVRGYYSIRQKKRRRQGSVLPSGNEDWWCSFETGSHLKPCDKCNDVITAAGGGVDQGHNGRRPVKSYVICLNQVFFRRKKFENRLYFFKYSMENKLNNLTVGVFLGNMITTLHSATIVTLTNTPAYSLTCFILHRQNQFPCSVQAGRQTNVPDEPVWSQPLALEKTKNVNISACLKTNKAVFNRTHWINNFRDWQSKFSQQHAKHDLWEKPKVKVIRITLIIHGKCTDLFS